MRSMNMRQFYESVTYAWRGLRYIFAREQNIRIQSVIALCVMLFGYLVDLRQSEWIVIGLLITMVLILEILNSIMERFIDMIKPRFHEQVQIIKDMLAAMVLVATISTVIIGSIIFLPHINKIIELLILR